MQAVDEVWERLCCLVVGEAWPDDIRPTVNGVVAKIRPRFAVFQIWVTKKLDRIVSEIHNRALGASTVAGCAWDYVPHPKPGDAAPRRAAPVESSPAPESGGSQPRSDPQLDA